MVKITILPSIVGGGLSSKSVKKLRKREANRRRYRILVIVLSLLFWSVLTIFLAYNVVVGDVIFSSSMGLGNVKMGQQEDVAERPFYIISSIPLVTRSYLHAFVKRGSCEGNSRVITSRCCRGTCGGMTSRVEGLAVLLMFAKHTGRKLCLAQDYFFSGDAPICNGEGAYLQISDNSLLFPQPMARGADGEALTLNRQTTSVMIFKNVKYISSSLSQNSSKLLRVSLQPLTVETGDTYYDLRNARRLGMAAIAYSCVLDKDMGQAEDAVDNSLSKLVPSVPGPQTEFIALFVKAGGAFTSSVRKDVHILNQYDRLSVMGRNRSAPDSILQAAWAIRRTNYKCNRPLFIISDSSRYRTELLSALPSGFEGLTCCSSGLMANPKHSSLQHLVDLSALGMSKSIFKTPGGYAELGEFSKEWGTVPTVSLGKLKNAEETYKSWKKIFEAMKCSRKV